MRIALFAGSFDPVTLGHVDIVSRASHLFDEVVIGVGNNVQKQSFFSLHARLKMLELAFEGQNNVKILPYEVLTVEFAKSQGAQFLLRGLRNGQDLEYEKPIALINRHMEPQIETVYLVSSPEVGHISSTLVREVARYGRDTLGLVPSAVAEFIAAELKKG
jgi:pantetheine-phosphate adenylyltransferase